MVLLNVARARTLLEEHGVDAVVGTTPENVTYLSGHQGWVQRAYRSRQNFAVLTMVGGAHVDLVVNGGDITYFAARGGDVEEAVAYGGKAGLLTPADDYQASTREEKAFLDLYESSGQHPSPVAALASLLRRRRLDTACIAFDEEGCSPSVLTALQQQFPSARFVPASTLLLMIRLVKTSDELELMRRAAEINRDALEVMFAAMRPGISEVELAAIWRAEVARAGAMWYWLHLGTGARSAWVFPPTERRLQVGDLFLCDAGITYQGYNADTGTSGSIGVPRAEEAREFGAVEAGIAAALDVVREGVTGGTIFHTMVDTIRQSGIPDYNGNFAGHTIGLEPREFPFTLAPETRYDDPFLPPSSELPLPAGSVINIESPIGRPGWGGYHIEYTIVITPSGYEEIVEQRHDFRAVEA